MHIDNLTTLLENGKIEEALDYLETMPVNDRENWEVANITGVICSYCGQYEEAVSFFKKALLFHPDAPEIYYNLADAYLGLERFEQAELMLKCCEYSTTDTQLLEAIKNVREQFLAEKIPEEKNNMLMFAYYFPPLAGSGVFRSIQFAKNLPLFGWNPTVVSTDMPPKGWNFRDDSLVAEIPEGMEVIRIPDYISTQREVELSTERVNTVIKFLYTVLSDDKEAMSIFVPHLSAKHGVLNMMTFPCSCLAWACDVVKYVENNVDLKKMKVVYTTSGPASSHLIGYYLKKKYGIPWVADYRDPWTGNPYSEYNTADPMYRLILRLETILLQKADVNITIEKSWVQTYRERFNLPQKQMTYITNGYAEEDFLGLKDSKEKTEKFTIGYSGLIYSKHRSIVPVLTAIRQLINEKKMNEEEVCIKIVGGGNEEENTNIAKQYGLDSILSQTGYVTHGEALQLNLDSDLLLLLVGDEERAKPFLTAKIFDYLRSGKPILALAPKDGAVDEVLKETGHGKTLLSTQREEIKEVLWQAYQKWTARKESETVYSPKIKLYERKYLTMKLADVLFEAANN